MLFTSPFPLPPSKGDLKSYQTSPFKGGLKEFSKVTILKL
jgi:hypothetical protein